MSNKINNKTGIDDDTLVVINHIMNLLEKYMLGKYGKHRINVSHLYCAKFSIVVPTYDRSPVKQFFSELGVNVSYPDRQVHKNCKELHLDFNEIESIKAFMEVEEELTAV